MTDSSRCEARLSLTLESRGILRPTVERPPIGDVRDGNGQVWDFKAPHSRAAIIDRINTKAAIAGDPLHPIPEGRLPGEFDVKDEVLSAIGQQMGGEGVIFDLRRLSIDEARSLLAEVAASDLIDPALIRYDSQFETAVLETMRRSGISAMWGFEPGPDFVVELPGEWFAAVEVTGTANRRTLATLADRADLIVVPDNLDVRVAMNNTPITRLRGLEIAIIQLEPSRLKPFGAVALLAREAARLRPYVALAARDQADPSFISRLSVYLDTKEEFILGEGDRRFAKQLPAHLRGEMPARGAAWAQEHREEITNLLSQSARIQQGEQVSTEAVTELARQAWRLEHELAATMQPER